MTLSFIILPPPTITQPGLFGDDYPACPKSIEDDDSVVCPNCEDTITRDDLTENPDGDEWCEDCATADTFICDSCDERAWDDDCTTIELSMGHSNTHNLCESCTDNKTITCDDCGGTVYTDDAFETANGSTICIACYEEAYITCEDCGDIVHQDNSHCNDSGCYCSSCRPSAGRDFDPNGFRNRSGSMTEIGSARCFGIELETDECDGYNVLEDTDAWGAKDDPTVSGKEFYSDILSGDDGLEAIRKWGKLANHNDWQAGGGAGYHLHIDMRGESDDSLFAIAYAYRKSQSVWQSFVESRRLSSTYSRSIEWNCADIFRVVKEGRTFYSFANRGTRYIWCNLCAYSVHSTLEIRLHEGTCDDIEVINWVKVHTRFADWASDLGFEGVVKMLEGLDDDGMFRLFSREVWRDYPLSEYYAKKARHHNHGYLGESINLESCSV